MSTQWEDIVLELYNLMKENDWILNFNQAIADAKRANVPDLDEINDLTDYLNDINKFLFWKPTENERGDVVYNKICLFYWILEQRTTSVLQSVVLPNQANKQLTTLSQWMVDYANCLGAFYDTEDSINAETIETFYNSPAYKMDQYLRPEGDWKTFNEFFARHVNPGLRNPDDPTNPEVIVGGADSVFDGQWQVDDENNVFFVKGVPWNIKELLKGSDYAERFQGGTFMHAFLNTTDYHRLHAPVPGAVVEAKVIQGAAYLEVVPVTDPNSAKENGKPTRNMFSMRRCLTKGKTDANIIWHEYRKGIVPGYGSSRDSKVARGLDAPDTPGYQFLQARGCIIFDSPIGLVAMLPVGMAQVSSVKLSVEKGQTVEKGQEVAYFQFGGSDYILVFEKGSQVNLTAQEGTHYLTGQQIGTGKVPSLD
ncbi:phosphatidylserine decarboxylase-related protein [Tuber indicum]|nr:phosphatidylserine decarboxylase-related protein [Tuber indicum]